MKTAVSREKGKIIVEDMQLPELKEGELLVKLRACGVCGSDLEKVYGDYGMSSKRVGHELAGEVMQSKSDKFAAGDRVFVHHHVPCYSCYYCLKGDHILCSEYQRSNVEPCGLSEYFIVPEWNVSKGGVIKLPDKMSFEEAALAEPLACCIKAINKLRVQPGDTAAVIGAGPAGIMNMMILKNGGAAEVFAIDISDYRINFAKRHVHAINAMKDDAARIIKNATNGRGVDIVVVATGNPKAIKQALDLVRKGGKIMIFGVPSKGTMLDYDANFLFANEIQLLTSGYCTETETHAALKLIESGKIDVKELITHRFPIAESQKAFDLAHSAENAMKVVITGSSTP